MRARITLEGGEQWEMRSVKGSLVMKPVDGLGKVEERVTLDISIPPLVKPGMPLVVGYWDEVRNHGVVKSVVYRGD